MSHNAHLE